MILANTEIHQALDAGHIGITPEPLPRVNSGDGVCPYQTSAVDLKLGNEISFFNPGLAINIDLTKGGFAGLFGANSTSRELTNQDQPYVLEPQRLVLGKTLEKIDLPINDNGPCFAARVEGKSSYARCGLLVHFTAPTIHSGFSGHITLELINLGPLGITLRPGMPICQLILEAVSGTPFRNDSQFQGQSKTGGNV